MGVHLYIVQHVVKIEHYEQLSILHFAHYTLCGCFVQAHVVDLYPICTLLYITYVYELCT